MQVAFYNIGPTSGPLMQDPGEKAAAQKAADKVFL